MKKNVASQAIGAQMVSATDGSAFTGSVTVYVTGDAGTQALGSVGSGACTHEGNGYHTYAPAQAETNYDLVAFTFIGSGAVPATVQVFTSFPQTGDSYARIGATGSGLTTLATQALLTTVAGYVDTEVAAIKAKTDNLPASPAAVGDIPTASAIADQVWDETISGHAGVGSTGAALSAAGGSGDPWSTALPGAYGVGTAGKIVGDYIDAAISSISAGSGLDAAGVRAAVGLATANLDTQLGNIVTDTAEIGTAGAGLIALASAANLSTLTGYVDTEVAAIKAKTDNLPASPAAVGSAMTLSTAGYEAAADAILNRNVSGGSNTGRVVKQAFHFIRNKWVVAGGTLTVYDTDDTTSSWTSAVTGTAGADPITSTDPT